MPTTDNPNDILDEATLSQIGNYVKVKAQQLAPSFIAPWIRNVEIEKSKDGKYGIKLRIDLKKIPDRSPAKSARAYEYGSGIHAQRGAAQRYKIEPRTARGVLTFYWEKLSKTKKNPNQIAHFMYIMHPGVEAANNGRGYLREALVQSREYIRENILQNASDSVKLKVRAIFSRPGGKNK